MPFTARPDGHFSIREAKLLSAVVGTPDHAAKLNDFMLIHPNVNIEYCFISEGPSNRPEFTVLFNANSVLYATAAYPTKREAKFAAAAHLMLLSSSIIAATNLSQNRSIGSQLHLVNTIKVAGVYGNEINLKYSSLLFDTNDLSTVPQFLAKLGITMREVRLSTPITADSVICFAPIAAIVTGVPSVIGTETCAARLWYTKCSPEDREAFVKTLPKSVASDKLIAAAYWVASNKSSHDWDDVCYENVIRIALSHAIPIASQLKDGTMAAFLLASHIGITPGPVEESGDVMLAYALMKLPKNFVYESQALARNALMHALNGNTPVLPAGTTLKFCDTASEDATDSSSDDETEQVTLGIRIKGDDKLQFYYADVTKTPNYARYADYLFSVGTQYPAHYYISSDGIQIQTDNAYMLDVPSKADIYLPTGYMWYKTVDTATQAKYIAWIATNPNVTVQPTPDIPYVNIVEPGYKEFGLYEKIRFGDNGASAAEAAARNRNMHALNGNIDRAEQLGLAKMSKLPRNVPKPLVQTKRTATVWPKKSSTSLVKYNASQVTTNHPSFGPQPKKKKLLTPEQRKQKLEQKARAKQQVVKSAVKMRPMSVTKPHIRHAERAASHLHVAHQRYANDPLHVGKPVGINVMRICMNLMLPDSDSTQFPVARYSDVYGATPTACTRIKSKRPAVVAALTDGFVLNNPDFVAIFRRDPFCSLIHYDPNTQQQRSVYTAYAFSELSANAFSSTPITPFNMIVPSASWVPVSYFVPTSTYAPHGQYLYPLKSTSGGNYFYAASRHAIQLTFVASGPTYAGMQVFFDNGGTDVCVNVAYSNLAAGNTYTMSYQVNTNGYYAVKLVNNAGSGNSLFSNVALNVFNANNATMAHHALPGLEANIGRTIGIRTNGFSGMLSNFTNLFTVQGSITGMVVPGNRSWCELLSTNDGTKILSASDSTIISQETEDNGFRVWVPPNSDTDFEICTTYEYSNQLLYGYAPLHSASNYGIVYYSNLNSAAMQLEIITGQWIEWYSEDLWTDSEISQYSKEEWEVAIQISKDVVKLTANPIHWLAIAKGILAGIEKYGESIGKWAGIAAGKLNAAI